MSRADTSEYNNFNLFWNFEYTRRNDPKQGEKTIAVMRILYDEVDIVYDNSEQMLDFILSGKFTYRVIPPFDGSEYSVRKLHSEHHIHGLEMRDEFDRLRISLIDCGYSPSNAMVQPCVIDFSRPLRQIVADVKSVYAMQHSLAKHEVPAADSIHQDSLGERIRADSKIRRLPKRNDRDLPRAIGLWLWDYLHDRNLNGKSFHKAREAFESNYRSKLPVDMYVDESQIKVLYMATANCIRERTVLPLV